MILGGTALTAQVEGDLQAALDAPLGEGSIDLPDEAPPLKLENLKLPEDVLARLPKDAKLLEDLQRVRLPEGTTIDLPEGFDLSDLKFNLPEDFDLDLPAGTEFDPATSTLKLPNGGSIRLPDGRKFDLPPGSTLTLPPELAQALLDRGLPAGTLGRDRSFALRGMPQGLDVRLDPPKLPGNGTLQLPPGTELVLPPGTTIPPEALAGLVPFLLPEGTEIDLPEGTWDGSGEVPEEYRGFPLPRPSGDRTEPPPPPPEDPRVAVATEIDTMPTRVPKGSPFRVQGYVREHASGRDVAGAPVVIYLNETKERPGVAVGSGVTDARGRFDVQVRLPDDKPARQWQLVNHAGAFTSASGVRYADGWGDPPLETYAGTTLALDAPARAGQGAAARLRATLLDSTGAPVPFARVELLVDGALVRQAATSAEGLVDTTHVFTQEGAYRVQARFPGNAYYDASESAERVVTVDDVAIDVGGTRRVERGTAAPVSGRVLVDGAGAPAKEVRVVPSWGGAAFQVVTDAEGRFSSTLTLPDAPGLYSVRYEVAEYGVSVAQDFEQWTRARLALDAPGRARVDLGADVLAGLRATDGDPLAGQSVVLTLSGPGGSDTATATTTTAGEVARTLRPPQAIDGRYTVTARLASTRFVEAAPATRTVVLGSLEVEWDMPATLVRGRDAASSATLAFAGAPLADERVGLSLLTEEARTTDAEGRVSWTVRVHPQAPLGAGTARLTVASQQHSEERPIRIVAVPSLSLEAPASFEPGQPVQGNLTLVDDLGQPLAGHEVSLTLKAGNWTSTLQVATDAQGRWGGPLDTQGAPPETLVLTARHAPQRDHLEAQAVRALSSSVSAPSGLPWWAWAGPLAGLALVGAAAIVVQRRRAVRALPPPPPPAPVAAVLRAPGFDFDVGIPPGEPLVWGAGEPLDVVATAREAVPEGTAIVLQGGGSELRLPLAGGAARATLVFDRPEEVRLSARRSDDALAAPVEVDLRVVEYRKEIAREFDLLLDRARAVEPTLSRQTTAQEMEWILGHRLGPQAARPLSDVALVMDVANYSKQPVGRADYLRFFRAARALDPLLAPPARAAPPAPAGPEPAGGA